MALADLDLGSLERADLIRHYRANSSYDLTGDVESARIFIAVARCLLSTPIKRSSFGSRGEEVELAPEIMQAAIAKAESWYAAHSQSLTQSLPRAYRSDPYWREEL